MKKVLLFIIATAVLIHAQDTLKNYNLGEIVVTSEQSNLVKSSSVIDINKNMINQTDGYDITESLKFYPGIYITNTSKNESKIYMRGYDQRQITVFLDGVPIYEPYSGLVDLSNLHKNSFEKITVSKGMPSLAYGANSMGGTINFITKDRMENNITLNIESGARHSTSAGVYGAINKLFYQVNAGYSKSNGFQIAETPNSFKNEDGGTRNNSDYKNIGGMLKIGVSDFYNIDLAYSIMIVNNEKGIPTDAYTSRPRYWRYTEWNKSINNLMFSTGMGSSLRVKGNVYYETYKNVLDSYDNDTFSTQDMKYAFRSTYDDHSFGINLLSDLNIVDLGITRLSFSLRKDVHKEEGNFNQGFSSYEASLLSTGLEQDVNITDKFSAVLGIGLDRLTPIYADGNNLRENSSSVNAFAGLSYKVNQDLALHINATKKSRFPTLKEFYSETAGRDVANPNLNVEQSIGGEFGIDYKVSNGILLNSNVFYSSIDELINLGILDDGLRQYQNIGKAVMKGAEFGLNLNIDDFYMNFAYTYLSANNVSDDAQSEILEYRPEQVLSLVPNYQFSFGTELRAELYFVGGKYGVNADSREFVKMDNYFVANIRASHTLFNNYTLFFRVNNIGNIYYETEYGFPQPGRELFFGVTCEW